MTRSPFRILRREASAWMHALLGPEATGIVIAGFSPPAAAIARMISPHTSSSVAPGRIASRQAWMPTLAIAHGERTVTITAGQAAPEALRTDGKAEKYALETGTVNRTAAWEGPQLRVAYDIGRVGTLTCTYTIVPTTRQLLIRVNIERLPGEPGPFEIKLVYNRTGNPAA